MLNMKREEVNQRLLTILEKMESLKEKSDLETMSVKFLGKEADKLIINLSSDEISFEQKEEIYKKIESLKHKIKSEIKIIQSSGLELDSLTKELNEVSSQIIDD